MSRKENVMHSMCVSDVFAVRFLQRTSKRLGGGGDNKKSTHVRVPLLLANEEVYFLAGLCRKSVQIAHVHISIVPI